MTKYHFVIETPERDGRHTFEESFRDESHFLDYIEQLSEDGFRIISMEEIK